ncbi:MAG: DUF2188 domain-containing protein [Candidatus Sedimenticola sp. (ex Thyasira tokunagai)]
MVSEFPRAPYNRRKEASAEGRLMPDGDSPHTRCCGVEPETRAAEVVIHRKNGRIRDSDSYGNDPFPQRDKKH